MLLWPYRVRTVVQCSEVLAAAEEGSQEHHEAQRLAARALFIAGDAATAISRLEVLLSAAPTLWRARAELVDCYRRAGRLGDAAAHLTAAASTSAAAGLAAPGFHYCRCAPLSGNTLMHTQLSSGTVIWVDATNDYTVGTVRGIPAEMSTKAGTR